MTNLEKYNKSFIQIFNIELEDILNLKYKQSPEWNSMTHLALISQIENEFNVDFGMDEIYDFKSYELGLHILKENFGLEF